MSTRVEPVVEQRADTAVIQARRHVHAAREELVLATNIRRELGTCQTEDLNHLLALLLETEMGLHTKP